MKNNRSAAQDISDFDPIVEETEEENSGTWKKEKKRQNRVPKAEKTGRNKGLVTFKKTRPVPRAVYYQCIWMIKDIQRLRDLEAMESTLLPDRGEIIFYADISARQTRAEVINEAMWKLSCIRRALDEVPEDYRSEILDNIVEGTPFSDIAHENTWKRWKHEMIWHLAENLAMI